MLVQGLVFKDWCSGTGFQGLVFPCQETVDAWNKTGDGHKRPRKELWYIIL